MRTRFTALAALTVAAAAIGTAIAAQAAHPPTPRILVFSKTAAFRHDSIPTAVKAVRELGARTGIGVDATEDDAAFTPARLARYDAVVFLMTTGDVLDERQQTAFEQFVRDGGGFVGVHSAADTEYGWPWYGRLLGTRFRNHPQIQQGSIEVINRRHPSTVGLPRRWTRTDEWYNFTRNPRSSVRVLARLDEKSYTPGDGAMGADHPITWAHEFQGGRAWFAGGGHTTESYGEPLFRKHLLGGIRYAAGLTPPHIESVRATVRNGRLAVSVSYRSCYPCTGELRVRSSTRPLRLRNGIGRAVSPRLPRGRWRFAVVLKDRATGMEQAVQRFVRVR